MLKKIKIPDGVEIIIEGLKITIKGQKGEVIKDFSSPIFNKKITAEKKDDEIIINSISRTTSKKPNDGKIERRTKGASKVIDEKKIKAMIGTIVAYINNMITGVTKGYKYTLKIFFTHFPITVETKKISDYEYEVLVKNFLGEKRPRKTKIKNANIAVEGDKIILTGINREKLGQAATKIEQLCRVSKKDRRIFHDGIFIVKREICD